MTQDWIKTLKAGDEVEVKAGGCYGGSSIGKVDKITPSGRVVIGTRQFAPNGFEWGGSSYAGRASLRPLTTERREKIEAAELAQRLNGIKRWESLPLPTLRAVAALLDAAGKPDDRPVCGTTGDGVEVRTGDVVWFCDHGTPERWWATIKGQAVQRDGWRSGLGDGFTTPERAKAHYDYLIALGEWSIDKNGPRPTFEFAPTPADAPETKEKP